MSVRKFSYLKKVGSRGKCWKSMNVYSTLYPSEDFFNFAWEFVHHCFNHRERLCVSSSQ